MSVRIRGAGREEHINPIDENRAFRCPPKPDIRMEAASEEL